MNKAWQALIKTLYQPLRPVYWILDRALQATLGGGK